MEGVKRGSRSDEEQLDVLMEERFLSASSSAGITGRTNSELEFFLFSPKLGISENQWKELCLKKQVQTLPGIVFTLIWDQCLGTGGGCGGEGTWEEGQRRNPGEREGETGNRVRRARRWEGKSEVEKQKRITVWRHVLNTTEEECCVQREALMGWMQASLGRIGHQQQQSANWW